MATAAFPRAGVSSGEQRPVLFDPRDLCCFFVEAALSDPGLLGFLPLVGEESDVLDGRVTASDDSVRNVEVGRYPICVEEGFDARSAVGYMREVVPLQ